MVNVHFSLLPRWRGAAPVERALLAGDDVTGVCIMGVEEGLDTGPGLRLPGGADRRRDDRRRAARRARRRRDPAARRRPRRTAAGADAAVRRGRRTPRRSRPTSCAWRGTDRPSSSTGWVRVGGAWTTFRGRRLKVHDVDVAADVGGRAGSPRRRRRRPVGTGDGALRLLTVQPEGKPPMRWSDFANGAHPTRRAPRPLTPPGHPSECFRPSEGLRPGAPQQTLGRSKHSGGDGDQ